VKMEGNDGSGLVDEYHAALCELWDEAMLLHGCSGCAARDLESKALATAEELKGKKSGSGRCAGICRDVRSYTKLVYRGKGNGRRERGFDLVQTARVSAQLLKVWDLGMKLTGCRDCVVASILYDVRTAQAETNAEISNAKDGDLIDGCRRCGLVRMGLL